MEKFKMTFSYEYVINDNAVICFAMPERVDEYTKFITKQLNSYGRNLDSMPVLFKGIARYKENDNYDVEAAKQIAKKKAVRQCYKWFLKRTKEFTDMVAEMLVQGMEREADLYRKRDTITNEIKEATR